MRITLPELFIAGAAIGSLCLLVLALWWSEHNRQREALRRTDEDNALATHVEQQCRELKASAR